MIWANFFDQMTINCIILSHWTLRQDKIIKWQCGESIEDYLVTSGRSPLDRRFLSRPVPNCFSLFTFYIFILTINGHRKFMGKTKQELARGQTAYRRCTQASFRSSRSNFEIYDFEKQLMKSNKRSMLLRIKHSRQSRTCQTFVVGTYDSSSVTRKKSPNVHKTCPKII